MNAYEGRDGCACDKCDATGQLADGSTCPVCGGTGRVVIP